MERASIPLASYALRMNRMNRRSTLPQLTREMIDAERARIRGMQTPKEWRNYLSTLERGNERYTRPGKKNGETVWKEEERKSIRIGKKKGEAVKQLSLTNYGKFEKLYTDPAGREWKQMTPEHQMRMAEYVIKTIDKYQSSVKHHLSDGAYRRMKQNEVREARLPALQKMITQVQKRIEADAYVWSQMRKDNSDSVMVQEMERTIRGMRNRLSILQGVEHGLASGSLTTVAKQSERKRMKKKTPTPTNQEAINGGRRIVEEWHRRAREQKLLPVVTKTPLKPLTQEDIREATHRLNRRIFLIEKEYRDRHARANAIERAIRAAEGTAGRLIAEVRSAQEIPLMRRKQGETEKVYLPEFTPSNSYELARYHAAKRIENGDTSHNEPLPSRPIEGSKGPMKRLRAAILRGWKILRRVKQ